MLASQIATAQAIGLDRSAVVIDPAHGGADGGAQIRDQVREKSVTLAVAERLRALLVAHGFRIVMTRDGDAEGGGPDQRAEVANRAHAAACLVIHASSNTKGVLVGTSALHTAVMRVTSAPAGSARSAVPWSQAQDIYIAQSGLLANQIGTGLARAGVAATLMHVLMRPLDNLTCPAVSIEVGVMSGESPTPVTDGEYQRRIAESIATSLEAWRNQVEPVGSGQGAGL